MSTPEHRHLVVDPLPQLRQRRSAKWRTYPGDVLPLTVAEMDYPLADVIATPLREAVDRSDTGYAAAVPNSVRPSPGSPPGPRFGALGAGYVRLNFATSPAILGSAVAAMAGVLSAPASPGNRVP